MNRLPIERHLGLYTAFHRDPRNRVVHQLAAPFVYGSVLLALQVLMPDLVLPLLIASVAMLAIADWQSAALVGLGLVAEWAAAVWLSHRSPGGPLLLLAAVMQGGAWAALIFIGHHLFEPHLDVGGQPASKGLYFERNFNLAAGLGAPVNLYDRVLQFSIAPVAHSNELLFALGLRRDLEQRVSAERERVVARLDHGQAPFGEERCHVSSENGVKLVSRS
jgi:uncharacterized membrane protein YGL010W